MFPKPPPADGAVYEPDEARHAVYQAAIARQRQLYDRLVREPDSSLPQTQ